MFHFRSWLRRVICVFRAGGRRAFRRQRKERLRHLFRPNFESLEVRVVPATDTFTNGGGTGLWNTAANWNAGVPTPTSDVVIGSGFSVVGPSGGTTVNSLSLNGTLTLNGDLSVNAVSTIGSTGTLTASVAGTFGGTGSLTDSGSVSASAGDNLTIATASFTNSGSVSANGATLTITPTTFTNFSAGTLTGGSWNAGTGGVINGFAGAITTLGNGASVQLNGGNYYTGTSGTTNALATLANINATAFFYIQNETFTDSSALSVAGYVTIYSGAQLTTPNYTQTGGSIGDSGTLSAATTLQGGYLFGFGSVVGNVNNTGATIYPGATNGAGTLSITGNYTQGSGGTLTLDVGGTSAGQYDLLAVSGTDTFAGGLLINLISGFTLSTSTPTIQPLTYASRTGIFPTLISQTSNGESLTPNYVASASSLSLQPEVAGTTIFWTGGTANWTTAADWSTGAVPTNTDMVYIPSAGNVTFSTGTSTIAGLNTAGAFTLSGGTLTDTGKIQTSASGTLSGQGGTLANAMIAVGSTLTVAAGFYGTFTLSGATVAGTVINNSQLTLDITGGLNLSGGTLTTNYATTFIGSQTVGGTGTFNGVGTVTDGTASSTITFASGVTVSGGLTIGSGNGHTWNFSGTVNASSGTLTFGGSDAFTNQSGGTWEATGSGTLTVGGAWSNLGTLSVGNGSTLNLGGTFTTVGIGTFTNAGTGTVNITGTLNNSGHTLALSTATGSWDLNLGTISGGVISTAGGATLQVSAGYYGTSTLSGVTLGTGTFGTGTVVASSQLTLAITGGLTLAGGTLTSNYATTFTGGNQTVGGTGTFNGTGSVTDGAASTTITFASGVTVSGGLTIGSGGGHTWSFQGIVNASTIGQTLAFVNDTFVNQAGGQWESSNVGTLAIGGSWTNLGTIGVSGSGTINLGGTFTTAAIGTFNSSGGTVDVSGALNNTGSTLALSSATGSWNLQGGTITGGVISTSGGYSLQVSAGYYGTSTLSGVTLGTGTAGTGTVVASSQLTLAITGGLTLAGGTLSNNYQTTFTGGNQTVAGTGTFNGTGTVTDGTASSTITFASGVTVMGGTSQFLGTLTFGTGGGHTWVFNGVVDAASNTQSISLNADTFTNNGTFEAFNNGTLTLASGSLSNLSSGVLSGGIWKASGDGSITVGSAVTTDAATIVVVGSGSNIYATSSNALTSLTSITAAGSLTIQSGYNLTVSSSTLTNAGTVSIGSGSTLAGPGSAFNYTQTTGSTVVAGTLDPNTVTISGGTLSGPGTIVANVNNTGGTIYPSGVGGTGGTLTITGNYTQGGGGTLDIDVGGTSGGQYDILSVSGTATLAGTLTSNLVNSFAPALGATFNGVLSFASVSGDFTTKNLSAGTGKSFVTSYAATKLNLYTAPAGTTVFWTGGSASWSTAADWSTGVVPTSSDNVFIGGSVTVAHASNVVAGGDSVGSLNVGSGAQLNITGGSTITATHAATPQITATGGIDIGDSTTGGSLLINAGGPEEIAGTGYLEFGTTASNTLAQTFGGVTLTIDSGVTVYAYDGTLGNASGTLNNQGTIDDNVNANQPLTLNLGTGTNSGTINVYQGTTATIAGAWTNTGTINVDSNIYANQATTLTLGSGTNAWSNATGTISLNSTASYSDVLNLAGSFTQASLGTFDRDLLSPTTHSTINLTGTLTGNLALSATTGSWNLRGGTLKSGTLSASGSAALVGTQYGGTLDTVVMNNPIDLSTNNGASVTILNNLTFGPGVTLNVGNSAGTTSGFISLQGTTTSIQTTSGTANIVFGPNQSNWIDPQTAGGTVTITSAITISGGYGRVGGNGIKLTNQGMILSGMLTTSPTSNYLEVDLGAGGVNQGTIEALSSNPSLYPTNQVGLLVAQGGSGAAWSNAGTISVSGGTLRIGANNGGSEGWSNTGTVAVSTSTAILSGAFTQAGLGNFTRDAASTVNLDGTLNGGLTLNDTLGAWNLTGNGVIDSGTYSVAGGSASTTRLIGTSGGGTLVNVTLASPIDLTTNSATVYLNGLLTVNTTQPLGDPTASGSSFESLLHDGGFPHDWRNGFDCVRCEYRQSNR